MRRLVWNLGLVDSQVDGYGGLLSEVLDLLIRKPGYMTCG